jgi:hypothetical protein
MAGTYGTRDGTRFEVNGVQYYTLIQSEGPNRGEITIKTPNFLSSDAGGNVNLDRTVGTIPLDNAFRPTLGSATTAETQYFSSAAGQRAVKNHAVITSQRAGAPNAQQLIYPNSASPDTPRTGSNPNTPSSGESGQAISGDNLSTVNNEIEKTYVEGTKKEYPDVKYPEKLRLEFHDCIKFSIIEYVPRGLSLQQNRARRTSNQGKKILGTITLPIPAGISDRNGVNWQEDTLDPLTTGFAAAATSFILGGSEAAAKSAESSKDALLGTNSKALEAFIATKAAQKATGSNNLLGRQFGAIINPNLELLFNGPQLRDFTFNFRFTPREKKEAENVRTIIRYFKQAMAPKRTNSVLLLKTPHTFRIQYLTRNTEHKYLNKFKECALTNCSVNYTPDGTYMTYAEDSSMTAYELQLTFQELEPIFDDDYGNENTITTIGY